MAIEPVRDVSRSNEMGQIMGVHELQHIDSPTWCVNCGRFDVYCDDECAAPPTRRFDSAIRSNRERMYEEIFGTVSASVKEVWQ